MKRKFWSICNSYGKLIAKDNHSIQVFDTKKEALKKIKWLNDHNVVNGIVKETVYLAECIIEFKK